MQQRKTNADDAERKLTQQKMADIHKKVTETNIELENKQKVISQFLRHGVVKEQELIKELNQQCFIIFYHFNRKLNPKYTPFLPGNKKLITTILEELGFVSVGAFTGKYFFHLIGSKTLPHPLDNVSYLEAYIKKRALEFWSQLESNLRKNNKELYNEFKKDERKKGNLSYLLAKVFPANLSIGYLNFSSFDVNFLPYCSRFVRLSSLEIDTQKLKDLISLASIDFFIGSIEPRDRERIMQHESEIKNGLQINNLLDYATITEEKLTTVLSSYFDPEKAAEHSKTISSKAREIIPIIKEFL